MTYGVDLIPCGLDEDGVLTSDDGSWFHGQTCWNILVTYRGDIENEPVLDIDIPVDLPDTAAILHDAVARKVEIANRLGITLT